MLSPRAESFKNDLICALTKELEVARKLSQGERSNEATDGLFVKQQTGGYVYEFENLTGWKPKISFEQILLDTLNFWREKLGTT